MRLHPSLSYLLPKTMKEYHEASNDSTTGRFSAWVSQVSSTNEGRGPDFKIPEELEAFDPDSRKYARRLFAMITAMRVQGELVILGRNEKPKSDIDIAIKKACEFEAEFTRKTKKKYDALDNAVLSWLKAGCPKVSTWPCERLSPHDQACQVST